MPPSSSGPPQPASYGPDERNGTSVFGKQKVKLGLSFAQTCMAIRWMEGLASGRSLCLEHGDEGRRGIGDAEVVVDAFGPFE